MALRLRQWALTSPPLVILGFCASILCVNWYLDFLTPLPSGRSSSMLPGLEPWKIYFSLAGTCANTSGARLKFLAITDLGVCAAWRLVFLQSRILQLELAIRTTYQTSPSG